MELRRKPNHTGFGRKQNLDEDPVRQRGPRWQAWTVQGASQLVDGKVTGSQTVGWHLGQVSPNALSVLGKWSLQLKGAEPPCPREGSDSRNDLVQACGHLATSVLLHTFLSQSQRLHSVSWAGLVTQSQNWHPCPRSARICRQHHLLIQRVMVEDDASVSATIRGAWDTPINEINKDSCLSSGVYIAVGRGTL